jgi:hypothetical protein
MKLLLASYTGAVKSISVFGAPLLFPDDELSKYRSEFRLNRVPFCMISMALSALPPFRRDNRYA